MPAEYIATPALLIASIVQASLCLIGVALCWQSWLGRKHPQAAALTPWPSNVMQFMESSLWVIGGAVLLQTVLVNTLGGLSDTLWNLLVPGGGFQLGLLGGALVAYWRLPARPLDQMPRISLSQGCLNGINTFLVIVPLALATSWLWLTGLNALGIDAPQQELIDMFAHADSPGPFIALSLVAIVLAPLTEEVIFRGGFFRFLLGRVPRPLALLLPAAVFAALHANLASFLPLLLLGVLFALSYERSGRLIVPIVAHSLFNLNTILLVLCGAAK